MSLSSEATSRQVARSQRRSTERKTKDVSTSPESQLAGQLALAWEAGDHISAEEFLAREGAAALDPQVAVRVIFEEMCLREEAGEVVRSEEYLRRFPQWKPQLELLLECQDFLGSRPPRFPAVGETLGEFRLDAELGRGGQGRVFLATQPGLADRQVVLKLTARTGEEHLSLARVQHTNIVPLYFAREEPEPNLRVFCMPYLGGTTLAHIFTQLKAIDPARRTVEDLRRSLGTAAPAGGRPAQWSAATYQEAICAFGVALAEALHYVHDRGLVHLDIKPSNVLITADGQPLLLDFHLAHEPIRPQDPRPAWFGGTLEYMAPEQRRVWVAMSRHDPIDEAVDGRADVYALGLILYQALGGVEDRSRDKTDKAGAKTDKADDDRPIVPLAVRLPQFSQGLSDIVARCLERDPARRYTSGAALAGDLRRHLQDMPLVGVPNRSLAERWQKWRRRRPSAMAVSALAALVLIAALSAGVVGWRHVESQRQTALRGLISAERLSREGRHREALDELNLAQQLVHGLFGGTELSRSVSTAQQSARARHQADLLHSLVEHLRFAYNRDGLSSATRRRLDEACRLAWDARGVVLPLVEGNESQGAQVRADLLELAVLWAGLVALPVPEGKGSPRAVEILDQAAAVLGPSPVLARERGAMLGEPLDLDQERAFRKSLKSGWEHYAYGRALAREQRLAEAAELLERAVDLAPQDFWANFYQADCAYRLRDNALALSALRVCISLAPQKAECYFNRGLVHASRDDWEGAGRDFDRALQLDPALGLASLERGKVRRRQERHPEALVDLQQARALGADPATVDVELARVHLDQKDRTSALAAVERALAANPALPAALDLQAQLRSGPR